MIEMKRHVIFSFLQQRNIKIDEELQKVKAQEYVYEWKEEYRNAQQQMRRKRLVKGKGNDQRVFQVFS